MNKILLLGANGQLGTDIQKIFQNDKLTELLPLTRNHLNVESDDIQYKLRNYDFDYLINCTAHHKVDECEDSQEKSYMVNAIAVSEMAKYCHKHNKKMIHISTDYVFDGKQQKAYLEKDITNPLNVYGLSKLVGEKAIQAYHDRFFIFRVSSLFGQAGVSGKGGNFVETMLRLAKNRKPIRVVNDQIMSPTHTLDVAKAIRATITNKVEDYGIYHCSNEGECSWYVFATEIFKQIGVEPSLSPVSSEDYITKATRPSYSVLSNEKLNAIYVMPKWRTALNQYLRIKKYISE